MKPPMHMLDRSSVAALVALLFCARISVATDVVNPGFEGPNNLVPIGQAAGPPFQPHVWGVETASVVTAEAGITPPEGSQMFRMNVAGGNATQAIQFFDVSPLPAGPVANLSALFNSNAPAARAAVILHFYANASSWFNDISISQAGLTLDSTATTWQPISLANIPVPPATTWVGVEVLYVNNTMGGLPGYVDDVEFSIVSCGETDCNANGTGDECDIAAGTSEDCNGNGVPDECDIAGGVSADCNVNGTPDECELAGNDCDANGVPDECDLDYDGDGLIDACDPDIDNDGVDNADDVCDFTPAGALIVDDPASCLYGTLREDLDGDCDVDLEDYAIFAGKFTGPR